MTLTLDTLVCRVAEADGQACLDADRGGMPGLDVVVEGDEVLWRFLGMVQGTPPAQPGGRTRAERSDSRLRFRIAKSALLDQRDLLPAPQDDVPPEPAADGPAAGAGRPGGCGRAAGEAIGEWELVRVFVACPEPAGLVADTPEPPRLRLGWSQPDGATDEDTEDAGEAEPRLDFDVALRFDVVPDRRWSRPVLEMAMSPATYAGVMAAIAAIE